MLAGEARDKGFQGLWEYAYDKHWYMPLFGLNWVHGRVGQAAVDTPHRRAGAVHERWISPTNGSRVTSSDLVDRRLTTC